MAVAADYQFDLNGFTFGVGASPAGLSSGARVSVLQATGFDLPEVNSLISVRTNNHGSFVTARYHKERVFTFTCRLYTTAANYPADTYALKKAFQAQTTSVPLTFQLPNMGVQKCNVYPQGVRFPMDNVATAVGYVDFVITLTAGDPRIYANSAQQQTLTNAVTTGGQSFTPGPFTFPVTFSSSTNGAVQFTNLGNFLAPITVTFTGLLTGPTLTNVTTGEKLSMPNLTIIAGDTLTIDTLAHTVLYNGSGSKYSALTSDSAFFGIAPNSTATLQLTTTSSADTGNATVAMSSTWI